MLQAASLFNQLLHHFPRAEFGVWRQLLFPVNDNYSSLSATTTSLPLTGRSFYTVADRSRG